MKRLAVLGLVFGVLTVGFWGCSSSSEPSSGGPSSYYPLSVGNWWKYLSVQVDSSGAVEPGTEEWDSTVVVGTQMIAGKNAAIVVTYDSTGTAADTSYMYADANSIWMFSQDSLVMMGVGTAIPPQWVKIADFTVDQWDILSVDLNDTVDFQGTTLIFRSMTITGKNLGTQQVTAGDESYTATLIEVSFTINMSILLGPISQDATAQVVMKTWYAQGVGPVKTETGIQMSSGLGNQWIGGTRSELIKYHVTM